MSIRDCIRLVDDCDPEDATAVRARVKELVDSGVPANEAWTEAAEMVMEDVLGERNELAAEIRERGGAMEDLTIENLLNPKSYVVEAEPEPLTDTPEPPQEPAAMQTDMSPEPFVTPEEKAKHRRQVDRWLSKPKRRVQNRVPVNVLNTPGEAPIVVPSSAAGYAYDGEIYVFRDNIRDEREAIMAIEHEAIGHLGIEGVLGQKKFDELIGDVNNIMVEIMMDPESHPQIRAIQDELKRYYVDDDGNYTLGSREEAREILAHIAHSKIRTGRIREIYNKVVQWVREWATSLGLVDPDITEIESIINRATDYVTKYQPTQKDQNVDATQPMTKEEGAAMIRQRKYYGRQEELNRQIREEDISVWTKAKNSLRRQLLPGGLLPRKVFDRKIERDSNLSAAEIDAKTHIWALEEAFEKDFGRPMSKITAEEERMLSDALAGGSKAGLPRGTAVAIEAMRQHIDSKTERYIDVLEDDLQRMIEGDAVGNETEFLSPQTLAKIELQDTLLQNIGQYVHRSYQVFDDADWPKKVPSDVLEAARKYLQDQIQADSPSMSDAAAETQAQRQINDILKNGTAFDDMFQFIRESKLGARDLSILKKKNNEIAPEILALMGEYKDPRLNFAKTVTKMDRLIFNDDFLKKIMQEGMGTIFFEPGTEPVGAYVDVAAEANEAYSPLNGMKTFPEVNQGLVDALNKENMDTWYRKIVEYNGMIKFGKTVLSPTTMVRNWMSAFFFTMANGHFDTTQMMKSIATANAYFNHRGDRLKYLRKLKELGVIYDTPYAGEMMRLLEDSKLVEKYFQADMKFNHAMDFVQKMYQFGDDFWKIIGFENEKALQMEHYGLSEEDAEVKAAERIRNTYPTYSMVGRGIQFLRRFPVVGTFVSFPAEMLRTGFNIMKYGVEDMKQSPRLGTRRALGMTIAGGAMYAAQEYAKYALGVDDEEDEAVRDQLPEWSRNSNLYYWSREEGTLRYVDLSFIDPYNIWKRPINALMRDEPIRQQSIEAGLEFLGNFFGLDIGFGVGVEIWTNKKSSGGRVYNPSDTTMQQLIDITNHIRKGIQPGVFSNLERIGKAQVGHVSPSGRKYKMSDEIAALGGLRLSTLDPVEALKYKGYQARQTLRDGSAILNSAARDPNPVSERALKRAFDRAMYVRQDAYKDLLESIKAARKTGVENKAIFTQLKAANISQRDIRMLLQGKVPPFIPSRQYLMDEIKAQAELKGTEAAELIKQRRMMVFKFAREAKAASAQ